MNLVTFNSMAKDIFPIGQNLTAARCRLLVTDIDPGWFCWPRSSQRSLCWLGLGARTAWVDFNVFAVVFQANSPPLLHDMVAPSTQRQKRLAGFAATRAAGNSLRAAQATALYDCGWLGEHWL